MALGDRRLDSGILAEPLVGSVARWAAANPAARAYTFVDYTAGDPGERHHLTWAQAHRRAKAIAARLREVAEPGDRVALLVPQGLAYITALIGAMYARVVAVPLFGPDLPGHADRLARAYADADPSVVVTTTDALAAAGRFLDERSVPRPKDVVCADAVDVSLAAAWTPEPIAPDDVAYLQYTSGSTRAPAGVCVTHRNITANALQLWTAYEADPGTTRGVSWLPLFHDMGLILTLAVPMMHGNPMVFTDPVAFVMRPARWLELLSEHDDVVTAGPNFAYEYCTARVTDEERARLDLSGVRVALNGAEPIRAATVAGFARAFAGAGLRPEAQAPGYGLAEATVYVCAKTRGAPRFTAFDRAALTAGVARPVGDSADADDAAGRVELAACGVPVGQIVAVVDPATRTELPDGRVGELWVHGPNVAAGYWRNPAKTAEVFGAQPAASTAPAASTGLTGQADPADGAEPTGPAELAGQVGHPERPGYAGSAGQAEPAEEAGPAGGRTVAAGGLPAGGWLRTGDLGVVFQGELYVTGRLKDLIIVDGRNHYPQDVEATAQEAHPGIRRDHVAAFAVPAPDGERLVVVAERGRDAAGVVPADVARAVRRAVHRVHELRVEDVVLVRPGGVPRTSSGKIARAACRERYRAGTLPVVG